MLLYYLGVSLYSINFRPDVIILISKLANLYQTFNNKTKPLTYQQIQEKYVDIQNIIIFLGDNITPKFHALTHYISQILKRSLFWNYSGFIFESCFNNLKTVATNCKISPFPAIENYLSDLLSLNLFNSLSRQELSLFGVNEKKIRLLEDITNRKINRRSSFCNVTLSSENQDDLTISKHSFRSFMRIVINNHQITTDRYSLKVRTANHFVVFEKDGNNPILAKIIAIKELDKRIFFKQGIAHDIETMERLFLGKCFKLVFGNQIKDIAWNDNLQKVVGFELGGFYYITVY